MRKMICMAAVAAVAAALLVSCSKDDEGKLTPVAAPVITLVGGDIDAKHQITPTMSVKVNVKSEGGIAAFGVKISSPVLTEDVLGELGLATEMDLVKPATEAMGKTLKGFGFPVGADVKGVKEVSFDISKLIPMIALLYDKTSDHNFTLTVTDSRKQTTTKTLKFYILGDSGVVYNEDADLWENTATLKVKLGEVPSNPVLEYKKSTESEWQPTPPLTENEDNTTYTATIKPTWKAEADHASGAKQYLLDGKTGVFAGHTYDYRLVNGGTVIEGTQGTFTAAAGQKIPGGDMNNWSKTIAYIPADGDPADYEGSEVYYPNAEGSDAFWSNGNNAFTQFLCQPLDPDAENKSAKLFGVDFGSFFAAGNLYSGAFQMDGLSGYARFGQKYAFAARPSALKVRYKATVTNLTSISTIKKDELTTEMLDKARIFVSIVDWTERHSVMSGFNALSDPSAINAFDPETTSETAEGPVLAYGSKWIDATTADWVELTIPILYTSTTAGEQGAKPTAKNYSLVISAAASAYGDYLCGSDTNELLLDDIEWVY